MEVIALWAAIIPATSRHTNLLLPLLPSGPGGVYSVSLREDRYNHHYNLAAWAKEAALWVNIVNMASHFCKNTAR